MDDEHGGGSAGEFDEVESEDAERRLLGGVIEMEEVDDGGDAGDGVNTGEDFED